MHACHAVSVGHLITYIFRQWVHDSTDAACPHAHHAAACGFAGECIDAVSGELTFFTLPNCFELFGFDLMVDDCWRVWLLEVCPLPWPLALPSPSCCAFYSVLDALLSSAQPFAAALLVPCCAPALPLHCRFALVALNAQPSGPALAVPLHLPCPRPAPVLRRVPFCPGLLTLGACSVSALPLPCPCTPSCAVLP